MVGRVFGRFGLGIVGMSLRVQYCTEGGKTTRKRPESVDYHYLTS